MVVKLFEKIHFYFFQYRKIAFTRFALLTSSKTIKGIRTIAPEENCPPLPPTLGLGFGLGLRLVLG